MQSRSVDSYLSYLVPNLNENIFNISLLCIMFDSFFKKLCFDSPGVRDSLGPAKGPSFQALKTRDNTQKYKLIFNSTFTGQASAKNKDCISRYLANKCSIVSWIYCFSKVPTSVLGEKLRDQVFLWDWGDSPKEPGRHEGGNGSGRGSGCRDYQEAREISS